MSPEELQILVTRSLDQSKKVRQEFFERLLREKIDLIKFTESDRLGLIKNGLTDFEASVSSVCRKYLTEQLCEATDQAGTRRQKGLESKSSNLAEA